jgi:hypothetical protein
MSKGNGHLYDCTCNWCSQSLYGASSGMKVSVREISNGSMKLGRSNPDKHNYEEFKRTYTNPNAQCQFCGQRVFFCQLENGGKVFFDELGPPWTKHPCWDLQKQKMSFVKPLSFSYGPLTFAWEKNGWGPFKLMGIKILDSGFDKIEGVYKGKKLKLFSKRKEADSLISDLQKQFELQEGQHPPRVQVKQIGKYLFKVSTFIFDKDLDVIPKEYNAFNCLDAIHKKNVNRKKNPNPSSSNQSKKTLDQKTSKKTTVALAFEKAKLKNK